MGDLIAKGISQDKVRSHTLIKTPDDHRPRQNRRGSQRHELSLKPTKQQQSIGKNTVAESRLVDLGLTYYIATNEGVRDTKGRKSGGCTREKSKFTRTPQKWSSRTGRRGKSVPRALYMQNLSEQDAAFSEDDTYESEKELTSFATNPRCSFNFSELPLVSLKMQKEDRRAQNPELVSTALTSVIFVEAPDYTKQTAVQKCSGDTVKLKESSQRLFHVSGDSGSLDRDYPSDDGGRVLDGPRVAFSDVGLTSAACLVFYRTFFGVQCLVKGPEPWLSGLQEFRSLRALMKTLLHPIVKPSPASPDLAKRLLSPLYQEDRCVNFFGPDFFRANLHVPVAFKGFCHICCKNSDSIYPNACGHLACDTCWVRYFAARSFDGCGNFVCMERNCHTRVDPGLAGFLAPWEVLQAWQSRALDVVLSMSGAKWCTTAACSNVFIIESSGDSHGTTLLQCSKCDRKICR